MTLRKNTENSIWRRSRLHIRRNAKTTAFAFNSWHTFCSKEPWELLYIQTKNKHGRPVQVQGALLVFNYFSHSSRNEVMSLAPLEKWAIFRCPGKFYKRRKLPFCCSFARFELSSSHFNRENMNPLMHFLVIIGRWAWRTIDFKAMYSDFGR